jgi:hypothetical protein
LRTWRWKAAGLKSIEDLERFCKREFIHEVRFGPVVSYDRFCKWDYNKPCEKPNTIWKVADKLASLVSGGATENDSELLYEGSSEEREEFLHRQIEQDFPGLLAS